MTIIIKNSYTLLYKEFKFKCCIGKKGLARDKKEGDKKEGDKKEGDKKEEGGDKKEGDKKEGDKKEEKKEGF